MHPLTHAARRQHCYQTGGSYNVAILRASRIRSCVQNYPFFE